MRKKLLGAIGVLSVLFLAILAVYALTIDDVGIQNGTGVQADTVLTFPNGSIWRFSNISLTAGNTTVLNMLNAVASEGNFTVETTYYGQYDSLLVDAIAGIENGQDDNYWLYWINGDYASVGADRQPVRTGDTVEWRFTTYG